MTLRFRTLLGNSPLVVVGVALALIAAGSVFAASGLGALVTGGEDGAATAQSAQAPVGAVSAGVQSDVQRGGPNPPASEVLADVQTGDSGQGAPASGGAAASGAGGGGIGQLPFTGFLAIAVLLVGAALLVVGSTLRRRTPDSA